MFFGIDTYFIFNSEYPENLEATFLLVQKLTLNFK